MSWRRILLFSIVILLALGTGTWLIVQRSDAATSYLRRELTNYVVTPASVASTAIDLSQGRLSVFGLRIDDPTRPGTALLQVAEAHIEVEANPLGELWSLHGLSIEGATIDLGPTLPRLDQLLRDLPAKAAGAETTRVPPIRVNHAHIRYTAVPGAPPFELSDVELQVAPVHDSPEQLAIQGKAHVEGLDATLQLLGEIDLATGTVNLTASVRDSRFDRTTLQLLARQFAIDLHELDAEARITELTLHLHLGGLPGASGQAGQQAEEQRMEVTGQFAGVRATAPGMPSQIRKADVRLYASDRQNGQLTLHVTQHDESGQLDLTTEVMDLAGSPTYAVRATGHNLIVDAEAVAALKLFPLGRDLMAALGPKSGRADMDIYLRDPHLRSGIAEFDMTLHDGAMAFHGFGEGDEQVGFPLPLVDASGRVRLRDDVVVLENLRASIDPAVGGGKVALDGLIETNAPAGEDTTLDIRATDVLFTPDLREALTGLLHDEGRLYDRLNPEGRTDVEVHVRPRRQLDGGWALSVRPQRASMLWGGFPYRLEQLTGTVVARQRGVDFDLRGEHGEGVLSMRGRIPLSASSPDGIDGFQAMVELQHISVDDSLRTALAVSTPALDEPWRQSRPKGHFDGVVKVWRPSPSDPLHHDVQLQLDGLSLELPCPMWRATGLTGRLLVQGNGDQARIDFDALRGLLEHDGGKPAQLAMLGTFGNAPAAHDDLAFVVRGLELDDQLGESLETLGALGPGVWTTLRPSGTVDLVCRHSRDTDEQQLRLVLQLIDVGSDAPMLPQPARHMTGELQIANGKVRFQDVRAELGQTLVRCQDGCVETLPAPDGRTSISFQVHAPGFPLDGSLANLFTGPLRKAVAERQLRGRADIENLSLQFKVPVVGSNQEFTTTLGGQLRLYDAAMQLGSGPDGIGVHEITGIITLDESTVSDSGGQLTGMLRQGSLRVFGQPLESLEARFVADAERITAPTLTSRFQSGQLRTGTDTKPALHYILPSDAIPEGRLAANLNFEKVDVFAFLKECGWANPPYSGFASGNVTLERLDGSNVVDAQAAGDLAVERGDLGVVPLFAAIYSQLPAPERPRFDRLGTRFRLLNRRLEVDELALRSNLLAANGKGYLDLDGYLDVELKLDNLLGPSADPLLMPFVDWMTKNIVRFHLFGHLRNLHAEKRWVTERSPSRPQVVPMQPLIERPPQPDF
jgi:hypothetical protein